MDLSLMNKKCFRYWGCISLLDQIIVFTLSLLLKLSLQIWSVDLQFLPSGVGLMLLNNYFLDIPDKLDVDMWGVCPTVAAFLYPVNCCKNVASLSLFFRYYFKECPSKLAELVLPYLWSRSNRYSDRLHNASANMPVCYKFLYT